jgi:hypothetical protein
VIETNKKQIEISKKVDEEEILKFLDNSKTQEQVKRVSMNRPELEEFGKKVRANLESLKTLEGVLRLGFLN